MSNTDTILIVMAVIMGISVLLQIGFLIGLAVMGGKALKMTKEYGDEFRAELTPTLHHAHELLQTTKDLIARIEPRLDAAATDLAEIAHIANEETRKIQVSADEIAERIRRQAERMDGITTSALNGMDRVGHVVNAAVNLPIRQVSGVVAAVKAIVDTLRTPAPPRRRPTQKAQASD